MPLLLNLKEMNQELDINPCFPFLNLIYEANMFYLISPFCLFYCSISIFLKDEIKIYVFNTYSFTLLILCVKP